MHRLRSRSGNRYIRLLTAVKNKTRVEWAEVCYVPNEIGHSKKGSEYRYLAKREVLVEQQELPGMNLQIELSSPTMGIKSQQYKVFSIVKNIDWEGEKLIHCLHQRCGKSEGAYVVMKYDLAGSKLTSEDFGENAAWWWIMVLVHNLNEMMKRFSMEKPGC